MESGEGGIQTPGTCNSTPDFESGTFDHSDTSPEDYAMHLKAYRAVRFVKCCIKCNLLMLKKQSNRIIYMGKMCKSLVYC
jgi:hypothetical protein